MPRQQRSLGGEDTELVRFAADLRRLRDKAGTPSYRALARVAHYSSTTLSDAAGGRRLPTLAVTLAYVRACDGDETEWEQRWQTLAAEETEITVAPYLGLAALQVADADRFFGRAALVDDIVDRLARDRFVAVVGASGVGKSSLLRAGLAARLRDADVLTPGARPTSALEAWDGDRVLVIDQFEEVFTLCHDPAERARFIAAVVAAAESHRVVIGLRADFFAHCADYPELRAALSGAQVLVGAMTAEELRQVVLEPAERAGCTVEGQLVAAVVADAAGRAAALPMVSHALLETWRRRRGNLLTLADYRAVGGIEGALAQTAEERYGAMNADQQRLTRALFLRLIALGEGTEDTRRRISRDEIDSDDPDTAAVLDILADARLVTLDESTVELTHEALITAWPRLHRWLAENRDDLRTHRRLTEAVHTWHTLNRDHGVLYRGAQLMIAREWADNGNHNWLNPAERAFLAASAELEASERKTTLRRLRQLRWLTAGVVVLLVVVTGITIVAVQQREQAVEAREAAISRQLATQALTLADTRPDTAMLLSVQAFRTAPTAEARGALISMSTRAAYQTEFAAHARAVSEVAFTPDGRTLITVGEDHTMALWNVSDRRRIAALTEHDTWLRALAVSPDGSTVASGGDDRAVVLWHTASRIRTATLSGHAGAVKEAVFSPNGRLLATAGTDDTVILWDVASRAVVTRLTGHGGSVNSVAFSPDGSTLAAAGAGKVVVLWDVTSGSRRHTLTGHTDVINKLAYSRTGLLASTGRDSTVRLWHAGRAPTVLTGHVEAGIALTFSVDGSTLASAGNDHVVRLWDTSHGTLRARLVGHTTSVYALAFGAGSMLASAGENGKVILWDTDHATPIEPAPHNDLAFSPDGTVLAATAGDHTTLWDTARRTRRAVLPDKSIVNAVTFSPDGATVATANDDGTATLWTTDGTQIIRFAGHTEAVLDVAFSRDGRTLVTGSVDRTVIVWDIATRSRRTTLTSQAGPINGTTFSPDGRTLITTSHDTTVVRWNTVDWTPLGQLTGHTGWVRSATFSPDSSTLATTATDATVRLWDARTGTSQTILTDHVDAQVNGAAFGPDTLAYTSGENTISVWQRETGTISARLQGHLKPIRTMAFSPAGATLVTAGDDDAILFWDTNAEHVAQRICEEIGRDLTADERRQFTPEQPRQPQCH